MKKIISLTLASLLLIGTLAGCVSTDEPKPNEPVEQDSPGTLLPIESEINNDVQKENPQKEENMGTSIIETSNIGFSTFDSELLSFVHSQNSDKNYMISPLSFKYAMALATAGADGETQQELLTAMGFETMDEYLEWTNSINSIVSDFEKELQNDIQYFNQYGFGLTPPSRALKVANSIWHNTDKLGTIKDSYIDYVSKNFGAVAGNVSQNELVPTVNSWVDENTNGMIPSLLSNAAAEANTILVNTLYMKSAWTETFNRSSTKKGVFTGMDGKEYEKDFMFQQSDYRYYEDADSQMVILPMDGGIKMAVVLGNNENILNKINNTTKEEVILQFPKFEVETTFDQGEFINYLRNKGVDLALRKDGGADFTPMIEGVGIHIDDIVQKTKITVDEDGTEAAAATAVIMMENTAMQINPKEPKRFIANETFTYYIYTEGENGPELLFFGQIAE